MNHFAYEKQEIIEKMVPQQRGGEFAPPLFGLAKYSKMVNKVRVQCSACNMLSKVHPQED